jgi:hypothetical protein
LWLASLGGASPARAQVESSTVAQDPDASADADPAADRQPEPPRASCECGYAGAPENASPKRLLWGALILLGRARAQASRRRFTIDDAT